MDTNLIVSIKPSLSLSSILYTSLQIIGGAVAVVVGALVLLSWKRSSRSSPPAPQTPKGPIALNPKEKIPFELISKQEVSHDTRRFRFKLQTDKHVLGLPVG